MTELRHQHTTSIARRSLRLACLACLCAIFFQLVHAWTIAATVTTIDVNWVDSPERLSRFSNTTKDGRPLYGDQSRAAEPSLFRPGVLSTGQGYLPEAYPGLLDPATGIIAPADFSYHDLETDWLYYSPPSHLYGQDHGTVITLAYGWPFVALCTDYIYGLHHHSVAQGIQISQSTRVNQRYPRALPTRVVTEGLVVNLLLYAAGCYGALKLGHLLVRRSAARLRTKRGQCVRCAYPLDGLAICPECGTEQQARTHD